MRTLLYVVTAALLLMQACSRSACRDLPELTDAWVQEHPDSVLALLERCLFPDQLPAAERAEYARLWAKACVAADKSFAQDTLLDVAIHYYAASNDSQKLSDCYRLAGMRQLNRNDNRGALDYYLKSEKSLPQHEDTLRLPLYRLIMQQALDSKQYELSRRYADRLIASDDTAWQVFGYYHKWIGFCWEGKHVADSGYYNIEKAIMLAEASPDRFLPHYLRNSISPNLPMEEALRRLKKTMILAGESSNVLLGIASLFLGNHQLDSAEHYLTRAEKRYAKEWSSHGREYVTLRNEMALLRSCLAFARGEKDFSKDAGAFNDSLYFSMERLEKTWEEQSCLQHRNAARELYYLQQRQQMQLVLLCVAFCVVLAAIGIAYYIRRKRNRWLEAEERVETLRQLLDDTAQSASGAPQDHQLFKKTLLQQLGILRLIATTPTEQNKELLQQIARINSREVPADSLLNWEDLYPVVDSLYENFHVRLVREFGHLLNEREVQLCCLLVAGFSTKEIGVVTNQSLRTVYQRKSDIRRKLQMKEGEDIVEYIRRF